MCRILHSYTMENIYKPRTDKIVHVWNALAEFRNELLQNRISRIVQSDTDIKEAMGFTGSSSAFEKLLESVDVGEHLSSPKDIPVFTFNPSKIQNPANVVGKKIPTKALKFKCVQHSSEARQGTSKRAVEGKLRYSKHKYVDLSKETLPGNDLVPFQEMLLVIRIYEPFKHKTGQRLRHPRFSHEFHVLSSQFLTELKDKIYCNCDAGPFYEISEKRSLWNETNHSNDLPKSGFFFIHDTFYNDLRHESHHDYSAVVRKWAEKQSMIGELRSESMEKTRFGDLQFRIGYPQLYQHQGNCEHLFVISDCRLLASSDVLARARYPLLISYAFPRHIPCNICGLCEVRFVVRSSNRQIFDPAYVCQSCLELYHYKDGQKVEDFELHHYISSRIYVSEGKSDDASGQQ